MSPVHQDANSLPVDQHAGARGITALMSGVIFGLGLAISQMINPAKVTGFLDVTGNWDPSLALVMGGAVAVTFIAFRLTRRSGTPLFDSMFHRPGKTRIDAPLVLGSAVFGVGWGLSGYCPGPGIATLVTGSSEALVFVAAMIAGSFACRLIIKR
jgi:uncharacterized membrane protein YedE/YeeE